MEDGGLVKRIALVIVVGAVMVAIGWSVRNRLSEGGASAAEESGARVAPVEVAPVEHGPIELRRIFSGTLESPAEFVVAPKISGRVERMLVDLADPVQRGQVVAELDNDEHEQAVAEAEAELVVAEAKVGEAESGLEIARRELNRVKKLQRRGVANESEYDTAEAERLARQAGLAVARAQVRRAEASLARAKIRLGYTRVTASWAGGDDERVVAARFVDAGQTVAANTPMLSIVELNPINGVVYVTEKDYPRLAPDQPVQLTTDAYPGETFAGRIKRVAPVFRQVSRQARVELTAANPALRLKPGMFVRAEVVLDKAENATIVPVAALVKRGGETGVFVVTEDAQMVAWRTVQVGIRHEERVQVTGDGVTGRVVTLGQQLIDDGSRITIPDAVPASMKRETSE
jgi:RND family efflux transporter MFP subunit